MIHEIFSTEKITTTKRKTKMQDQRFPAIIAL